MKTSKLLVVLGIVIYLTILIYMVIQIDKVNVDSYDDNYIDYVKEDSEEFQSIGR